MEIKIEDHLDDQQCLSIGIYINDRFTGCFWDSHEQTNKWIITDMNIKDNLCDLGCDFDEDDYQAVFVLCVNITQRYPIMGVRLLRQIMEAFDHNYDSDEGIITKLKK